MSRNFLCFRGLKGQKENDRWYCIPLFRPHNVSVQLLVGYMMTVALDRSLQDCESICGERNRRFRHPIGEGRRHSRNKEIKYLQWVFVIQ